MNKIIAIDGPAGSGKSTIARLLSQELQLKYIDSGAIYRTLALSGLENFGQCQGQETKIVESFKTQINSLKITYQDYAQVMWLNNSDVSKKIRTPRVTKETKYIADHPGCREIVNEKIRELSLHYSLIIDGRDIGTKVFPNTPYKFYLDADIKIRAKRRAKDLKLTLEGKEFEDLLSDIIKRDKDDMNRQIAPLIKAEDAYYLDTSDLAIEKVVDLLKVEFLKRG